MCPLDFYLFCTTLLYKVLASFFFLYHHQILMSAHWNQILVITTQTVETMKVLTLVRVNWDIPEMAQTVKVFYELNVKFLTSTKENPVFNPTGRNFALHRCGNTSRGVSTSTSFFSSVYSSL